MTIDSINFSAISLRGKHDKYEDRVLCRGPKQVKSPQRGYLFAVADGLSGERQASIAADLSIFYLDQIYFSGPLREKSFPDHLYNAVQRANWEVFLQSEIDKRYKGMGSTLSAVLFLGERAYVVHVGDSKIYYFGNDLERLTQDHLDPHGSLTEFIGKGDQLKIQATELPIEDGAQFLLCTDGLKVSPEEILRITRTHNNTKDSNQELVNQALRNGSNDDITSILLEIELD